MGFIYYVDKFSHDIIQTDLDRTFKTVVGNIDAPAYSGGETFIKFQATQSFLYIVSNHGTIFRKPTTVGGSWSIILDSSTIIQTEDTEGTEAGPPNLDEILSTCVATGTGGDVIYFVVNGPPRLGKVLLDGTVVYYTTITTSFVTADDIGNIYYLLDNPGNSTQDLTKRNVDTDVETTIQQYSNTNYLGPVNAIAVNGAGTKLYLQKYDVDNLTPLEITEYNITLDSNSSVYSYSSNPSICNHAAAMVVGSDNIVYFVGDSVVSSGDKRVFSLDPGTSTLTQLYYDTTASFVGIAIDEGLNLYVTDDYGWTIWKYDPGISDMKPFLGGREGAPDWNAINNAEPTKTKTYFPFAPAYRNGILYWADLISYELFSTPTTTKIVTRLVGQPFTPGIFPSKIPWIQVDITPNLFQVLPDDTVAIAIPFDHDVNNNFWTSRSHDVVPGYSTVGTGGSSYGDLTKTYLMIKQGAGSWIREAYPFEYPKYLNVYNNTESKLVLGTSYKQTYADANRLRVWDNGTISLVKAPTNTQRIKIDNYTSYVLNSPTIKKLDMAHELSSGRILFAGIDDSFEFEINTNSIFPSSNTIGDIIGSDIDSIAGGGSRVYPQSAVCDGGNKVFVYGFSDSGKHQQACASGRSGVYYDVADHSWHMGPDNHIDMIKSELKGIYPLPKFTREQTYTTNGQIDGLSVGPDGYLYIGAENSILKVNLTTNAYTIFAGDVTTTGHTDGTGTGATFQEIQDLIWGADNNLYVVDNDSSGPYVRMITTGGVVSTLAQYTAVVGPDNYAIAHDPNTNDVYLTSLKRHTILHITSVGGTSIAAGADGVSGLVNNTGGAARFHSPTGIAIDSGGTVAYICDKGNARIRKMTIPGFVVTTNAGGPIFPVGMGNSICRVTDTNYVFTDDVAIRNIDGSGGATNTMGLMSPNVKPNSGSSHVDHGITAVSATEIYSISGQYEAAGYLKISQQPGGAYNCALHPLADGTVLVVGSAKYKDFIYTQTMTAEVYSEICKIYDPGTNTFLPAASMTDGRIAPFTVTLANGNVLAIGGVDFYGPFARMEEYDPIGDTWTLKSTVFSENFNEDRGYYDFGSVFQAGFTQNRCAHLLSNGKVLICPYNELDRNLYIYDPVADSIDNTIPLGNTYDSPAYTMQLPDGKILIQTHSTGTANREIRLYDPSNDTLTDTISFELENWHIIQNTSWHREIAPQWVAHSSGKMVVLFHTPFHANLYIINDFSIMEDNPFINNGISTTGSSETDLYTISVNSGYSNQRSKYIDDL